MIISAREMTELKEPANLVKFKHGSFDADDVVSDYRSGLSINRIADELGATKNKIKVTLIDNGVHIRDRQEAAIAGLPFKAPRY